MRVLEIRSPASATGSTETKPTPRPREKVAHQRDVAGALVPESKSRADDDAAHAETIDQNLEERCRARA